MSEEGTPLDLTLFRSRLGVETPVRRDDAEEGRSFTLDRTENQRTVVVDVVPETRVVRIHTPLTDVTLRGAQVEQPEDEQALWIAGAVADELVKAMLTRDGKVLVGSYPAIAQPVAPEQEKTGTSPLPKEQQPTSPAPASPRSTSQASEKQKALRLTGCIGKEPRFSKTKAQKPQCTFELPVREQDDQEQPIWHTVFVYGEQAEQLKGHLHRGQEVFVVSYPKRWTRSDPRTNKGDGVSRPDGGSCETSKGET